jgi:ketosteroid isomerase-like protein
VGILNVRALPFLVCGLFGCAADTVERPAPPPVDWRSLEAVASTPDAGPPSATQPERAVAQAYADALASPGFSSLGGLLDEEAHYTFAGTHDVLGREKVVQAHESELGAIDNRTVALTRVLLAESSQVVEWLLTGTHHATRKNVSVRGVTLLWTKDDGSITDLHLYFDEAALRAQAGQGPRGLNAPAVVPASGELPQRFEHKGSEREERGEATVRTSLDALENNDENAYAGTMTDDVEWSTLESSEPLRGKVIARGYFKTMRKAIGQLDTQIDHAWSAGTYVAVEYRISGEQRGPLGWVPAQKDTLVDMHVVDVSELRDSKIARLWRYDNPAQLVASPPGGAR